MLQQRTRCNASIQLVILKTVTNALRMRNECGLFAVLMRAKRPISDRRSASRTASTREQQLQMKNNNKNNKIYVCIRTYKNNKNNLTTVRNNTLHVCNCCMAHLIKAANRQLIFSWKITITCDQCAMPHCCTQRYAL